MTSTNAQQDNVYYVKVYYADGSSAMYGPYRLTINRNCSGRVAALELDTTLRLTLLGNQLTGEALKILVEGGRRLALTDRVAGRNRPVVTLADLGVGRGPAVHRMETN